MSTASLSSPSPRQPAVATLEVRGFVLQEARYPAGYAGGEHRHPTAYLGYVVAGDFLETCGHGRTRYGNGSLHAHPAGEAHSGVVGARGARCFTIVPAAPLGQRLEAGAGDLVRAEWPARLAAMAARCHRAFLARDAATDLDCEGTALELLAAVLRVRTPRESGTPGWLGVARDYLHAHAGGTVTLSELAAVTGVHRGHVARVFRQRLGVTPAGYVRQLRLERACRALVETDLPLAQVALDTGYASQAHMTRLFRARLGETPARYRRARRASRP